MPNLENPLFFLRKIVDDNGTVAMASFLKLTAEAFLLVDHAHDSPEWRWAALQKLTAATLHEAAVKGRGGCYGVAAAGNRKEFWQQT